ncbi:polysaccharide biosynthesis/export family protein [Janthinobacterium psychrotolerans]|uniref:polysaccharide biosynthesis/export family protein n=1 Tax=Janthinobacterium psychrotolerans TaxID=1747903 RepID=UPI001FE01843|nr:SLBB domain-containing protein [Janthinobacterium psychrotolerans]
MTKITRRLLAVVLAVTSIYASAQNVATKEETFGQTMTSTGTGTGTGTSTGTGASTPETSRRVSIANSNVNAGAADGSEEANPVNRTNRAAGRAAPNLRSQSSSAARVSEADTSEFQKFIADSTGKILPVYGAQFFSNTPDTFTPISGAPVPADYPLGVGDELMIRGTGSIDIDYRAKIDRNGQISIPTIGPVSLAGVKAGDAESVIRNAVATMYKGVTISVNFGKLRAITVYVVGQANRPGTYTVSSLSTLVTTLFASGGPNVNGSMRHLQVKRGGKTVADLDLYAFIAKGDKSADIKLQDGDSIYIPAATGHVALVGKVNTPAIYELRSATDTIESILDIAGGMPIVADPRRAYLERIDASKNQPRSVEQFALNEAGLKRTLKNGDVLNVTSITPDFSNAVILRGNVDQAIRAPFLPGMHVSDLIPNREYLITRNSIKRQNGAVSTGENDKATNEAAGNIASRIGGLIDEINWDYAVVERINRSDLTVSLIPFNLGKVFSDPSSPDNVQLQPGDTVTIFSQQDVAVPMDKRRIFVRVEGEVKVPGVYQMTAGETLQSLLARAGGTTQDAYFFGTAFYREQVRMEQEINLEKAATKLENQLRLEQSKGAANARALSPTDAQAAEAQRLADMQLAKENIVRFRQMKPTGRIAFGLDPAERSFARLPQLKLENGDRLVIAAKPEFVHIFGSVNAEASPMWRSNTRVADYLNMAGLTVDADVENVFIMRTDGSVVARNTSAWAFGGIGGVIVMPGDSIVVPEKFDKETSWTKFTKGTREWAQIFANFGLGAAAVKTLRN